MSNQYLKLRRSNVPGKIPTTESIDFGEIALNTYDGLAYMKVNGPNGIEVVPIASSSGSFSGNFTGTFSGSLFGTASWAEKATTASYYNETDPIFVAKSASFATTSSFNSFTASYNTGSFTGSFVGSLQGTASFSTSASYALSSSYAISSSYALSSSQAESASYLNPLNQNVTITGSVYINGTASIDVLNVRYISSSVIYSSGSNVFGDSTQDTQELFGTVLVSGSQSITGSLNVSQGITGSLLGTASFATSASWAPMRAAGLNTQIQFNSASVFSGSNNLTFDYVNNALRLTGSLEVSGSGRFTDGLTVTSSINIQSGSLIGTQVNSPNSYLRGFFLDTHPETTNFNPTVIPFINNDIAYCTLRGGTCTLTPGPGSTLTWTSTEIQRLFNGAPDYLTFNPISLSGSLTVDIVFPQTFTFGSVIGFSFGNEAWRARDFTVETRTPAGVYTVIDTQTNYPHANYSIYRNVFPNTLQGIRLTFSNFVTTNNLTGFRIADIFVQNYNGQAVKQVFVGRDGGSLFAQLNAATGSTTLPGYSAVGDTNTGIYFPAADNIGFVEGGTEVMRIDSNARVGIGTTTPSHSLDVLGSGRFTNGLTVTGSLIAPSITGSLDGTASWARNAITVSDILGGKAPHVPYFFTDTSLATSSIYQSGSTSVIINQDANTTANPEALYVWQPHPTSINVISGKGNLDNYLQLNIQNTNQGVDASSDIVATANNGNENTNYIDMGINSENYNGFLGGPNDAYLYNKGENLWIGNYSDGKNVYFFNSSSEAALITLTPSNTVDVNTTLNAPEITGSLEGTASWAKNTISSSHAVNSDFAGYAQAAGVAANGGVTQIIAGSGVSLIPSTGIGNVTVIATGVGGVTILSGSNVTESFANSSTWNFTHSLGVRTPIINVFDSNYNQIIPENIHLVDTASAIITFPTLESGFAVASVGGVTGNALSSSYSLLATYADTASYYAETDPVFVARSASLATTGSNVFIGTQTMSGSLILVNGATGSLLGTSSYALNALSASFATTSSYGINMIVSGGISSASYIDFNLNPGVADAIGRLKFDSGEGTLQLGLAGGNVIANIGEDLFQYVYNSTGAPLTKGQVVYISGSQGNRIAVKLASAAAEQGSANTLGFVAETIAAGSEGWVQTEGNLRRLNTVGLVGGQLLYLSTTPGAYTQTIPIPPNHSVRLGYAERIDNTQGSIYIKIDNGYEIGELHDLVDNTTSSSFGDLLVKSGSVWINSKALTGSYSITGSLTVSGSSTFTNIGPAVFTGSVSITGSTTQTGNNTLIGNTTLSGSIDISGSQTFYGSSSFYGAHVLSGSNTIRGNTFMFGDIQVSGSSNFNNSEFIVTGSTSILGDLNVKGTSVFSNTTFTVTGSQYFTGSSFINGNQSLTGNSTVTGSLNVIGNINVVSGSSFTRWGNKLFNYAQFANTASILATQNVSASFTLPLTYFKEGISVVSSSRITFENTGLYNIQYVAIANQGSGTPTIHLWFKKTGSNIDNSSAQIQLQNNSQTALTYNFAFPFTAGEYVELWYHTTTTNTSFPYTAAGSGFPATPSIIVTVTQIA